MIRNLSLLCILGVLAGCGGGSQYPPTYKVTGTVTLDGSPVEGASITFVPDDSSLQAAVASSKADGSYTLTSFVGGDGAQAGSFRVQVFKYETLQGGPSPYDAPATQQKEMTDEELDAALDQAYASDLDAGMKQKNQKAKNELPDKYASVDTSGLQCIVEPKDDNVFNIELSK